MKGEIIATLQQLDGPRCVLGQFFSQLMQIFGYSIKCVLGGIHIILWINRTFN